MQNPLLCMYYDPMKFLVLLLSIYLAGCQHSRGPLDIDLPQLKSYLTQQSSTALWSSKARIHSLGGRIPSSPPAPTFGMPFSEAKLKAHVLDVRAANDFAAYNLGMDPATKVPVSNIPAPLLLDEPSSEAGSQKLAKQGITKDSIIIVICNKGVRSPQVAEKLSFWGYPRVLNYRGGYTELRSCDTSTSP